MERRTKFDNVTDKNTITKWQPNWKHTFDYPYRILIIEGSVSGKANALLKP